MSGIVQDVPQRVVAPAPVGWTPALPPLRSWRSRTAGVVAVLLALIALLLPPERAAALLAAPGRPLAPIVAGFWIFKGLLLAHAAVLYPLVRAFESGPLRSPLVVRMRAVSPLTGGQIAAVAALVAAGLVLRLVDLGDGLWHDEIATLVDYVRLPAGAILTTYANQNQHPLYTLLARGAAVLFGDGAWSLRLPAALLGTASLAALYPFATRVTSRREAVLAVALLTFSYHHVWFSQDGRGYTGLLLWTLIGSALLLDLLTGESRSPWRTACAYAVAMALAVYTHLTAAFIVGAHFLLWVVLAWRARGRASTAAFRVPLAAMVLAGTLSLLLYAPVLPQLVATLAAPPVERLAGTEWSNPVWLVAEVVRGAVRGLPGGWIGLAGGLLVAGAGIASFWRRSPAVVALMVLPGAITGAVLVMLGHNLWPRFFFFSAGFALLIAVRGVFALVTSVVPRRAPRLATALVGVVILASAWTVPRAWGPKQDYAGALAYVDRMSAAGDAVVTSGITEFTYNTYFGRDWLVAESGAALRGIERTHARTWLVYTFPTHLAALHPDVWARLQAVYRQAAAFRGTLGEGTVYVMVKK